MCFHLLSFLCKLVSLLLYFNFFLRFFRLIYWFPLFVTIFLFFVHFSLFLPAFLPLQTSISSVSLLVYFVNCFPSFYFILSNILLLSFRFYASPFRPFFFRFYLPPNILIFILQLYHRFLSFPFWLQVFFPLSNWPLVLYPSMSQVSKVGSSRSSFLSHKPFQKDRKRNINRVNAFLTITVRKLRQTATRVHKGTPGNARVTHESVVEKCVLTPRFIKVGPV